MHTINKPSLLGIDVKLLPSLDENNNNYPKGIPDYKSSYVL